MVGKKKKEEMINLYLHGETNLRFLIPLKDAQEKLGIAGYYVRLQPPLDLIYGGLGGAMLGVIAGVYGYFFGLSVSAMSLAIAGGLLVGGLGGFLAGTLTLSTRVKHLYIAWSRWDSTQKKRVIEPMEHMTSMELMTESTDQYKLAFLREVGAQVPVKRRPVLAYSGNGHANESDLPDIDNDSISHLVPTYSPAGFYVQLQSVVYRRVLTIKRNTERLIQMASLGTIAVSMLAIAALIILVFTSESGGTP
jgi:hypothetical protein